MTTRSKLILATICITQLIFAVDVTIVQIANATIARSLGFTDQNIQWVFSAYALTFGGFLLLGGRISDLFGRRRMFLIGMAGFGLSSLAAGLSQSPAELVVSRAFQGVSAAIVSPTALAFIAAIFPEGSTRHRAYAWWGIAASVGGAVGYVLGGAIVGALGWRWAFLINPPIAAAAIVAAVLFLPRSEEVPRRAKLDVTGAILGTGAIALLIYGVSELGSKGRNSSTTIAAILLAILFFATFTIVEHRTTDPILPFRLFHRRAAFGNAFAFLLAALINSTIFLSSLYQQQVLHYSPQLTGLSILPLPISVAIGSNLSPRLVGRFGPRNVAVFGLFCFSGSLAWFTGTLDYHSYLVTFLLGWLLFGFGLAVANVPLISVSTSGVKQRDQGITAGIYNTSQQVGTVIGLAALSAVAVSAASSLGEAHGIRVAFFVSTVIGLIGTAAALVALPSSRLSLIETVTGRE